MKETVADDDVNRLIPQWEEAYVCAHAFHTSPSNVQPQHGDRRISADYASSSPQDGEFFSCATRDVEDRSAGRNPVHHFRQRRLFSPYCQRVDYPTKRPVASKARGRFLVVRSDRFLALVGLSILLDCFPLDGHAGSAPRLLTKHLTTAV